MRVYTDQQLLSKLQSDASENARIIRIFERKPRAWTEFVLPARRERQAFYKRLMGVVVRLRRTEKALAKAQEMLVRDSDERMYAAQMRAAISEAVTAEMEKELF